MKRLMTIFISVAILITAGCGKGDDTTGDDEETVDVETVEDDDKTISELLSEREFQMGVHRFNNREYQAAIQLFNKSLAFNPMFYKARYYLGYAYLNSGYMEWAIDEWENLIALGGGNYQVKQKINDLYFRLAMDKQYDYSQPYVLSAIFDGITEGNHKIIRPMFIISGEEDDSLFISCAQTRYVVELDGNYQMIRQIGRKFGDFSAFGMPTGIAYHDDLLYVADFEKDKIFVFNDNGKMESEFGTTGYQSSNIAGPMGIYISPDEYLYVVDNGNDRVQKFDLDGTWVQSIGEDDLYRPTDIIGEDNLIYVSDTQNGRVVVYDRFGNLERYIGEDVLSLPRGLEINNGILYIVDAELGVFSYDIESEEIEKLTVDEGLLDYPFDICAGDKNFLYETDFNTQNIAIYAPLQLVSANLGVDISQIWLEDYPDNLIYFRVWDKSGQPVYGITEENVSISEEGEDIPLPRLGATYKFRENMYIVFVIDKSLDMEYYSTELEETISAFIESMTGDDWMDIVLVDDEITSSGQMDANLLWSLEFMELEDYQSDAPVDLGTAVYDSVTHLLNVYRNKAIVLFTSGALDGDTFSTYESEIVQTYAHQNAVPIYVINFSGENEEEFEPIADITYGSYYTLDDIKDINELHQEIQDQEPLEYVLSYEGLNLTGLKDYWVDVHLRIVYRDVMIGVDDTGYYVPELSILNQETIDLESE